MFKNFRLIASPTSPYARKVRIVMAEKRIECELEMMDVWAPDTRIQELNPLPFRIDRFAQRRADAEAYARRWHAKAGPATRRETATNRRR